MGDRWGQVLAWDGINPGLLAMIGNLFAGCMIAMLLGSLIVVKIAGVRPALRSWLMGALLAAVCFVGLATLTPAHACRRGGTVTPALLSSVLSGLVFATIVRRRIRIPVIIVLLFSGYILTSWGMELVHDTPYVGNPDWHTELDRRSSYRLSRAQDALRAKSDGHADLVLPKGWIEESWREATGEALFSGTPGYVSGTVCHFWHTWFTGIYRLDAQRNGFWCSGGPVAQCVEKLEIRNRSEPIKELSTTP